MSFVEDIKGFIEVSRVGKLLGMIVYLVRQQLDTDGDGVVEANEIFDAIPEKLLRLFLPAVVAEQLPTIIKVIIAFQKAIRKA